MIAYIDASVVLRFLLKQRPSFRGWSSISEAGTSELCWVECCRMIDRLRLEGGLSDNDVAHAHSELKLFFSALRVFEVTRDIILSAATPQTTVLGTLDAIHLHTALLWKIDSKREVTVLTYDMQLASAARSRHLLVECV